jgi:lipoprotein-anchoring transpeptidase ErfK/SrfK
MKRLALVLIALLAAGATSTAALADEPPPTTPPPTTTTTPPPGVVPAGVTLAGVQIGGLDPTAAGQAVLDSFNRTVTLRFERTTIEVAPSLFSMTVPIDSAVARALTVPPGTSLALRATIDRSLVRAFAAKLAARFNRQAVSSRLLLRNVRPFVTKSLAGRTIDQAGIVRDLADELVHATRTPIAVRAKLTQPTVTEKTIGPVIVIERGSNMLTLYDGAHVVRRFGVATGQAVYPTPLGKFQIVVMWRNPWWYPPASPWAAGEKPVPPGPGNPLGTRWMGLSAPGVGIHGTPDDGSIGYSLSHGCIRMHIPDAEWLFNRVKIGTPVYIVSA